MLYKVTPMMAPPAPEKAQPRESGQPRKRRKSAVYDAEGNEVLISLMCIKCRTLKPLAQFGLRKMADGAIRNQPWCRTCRSGAGTKKPKDEAAVAESPASPVPAPALQVVTPAPVLAEAAEAVPAEPPGAEEVALSEPVLAPQVEGEPPPHEPAHA
ncbi:hypothetical protein [Stigmatella aurantiaca]|uniref:Conserved uncharacterized protein n=1 Tax=Stigmatella aurantiaca (strain DW4/3-1) TaxID=378806 RepID=Q08T29_STIAD|nr:hypothetical protein [Stigmatella aurantiaca]ADO73792.1 conserved uncharacterized protein [Stigmatella aurantiaca DW4/3-1]EAU63650.1 hypothetical protein STIAU_7610 [Stigmatella aurantiaca DW4/3-1]